MMPKKIDKFTIVLNLWMSLFINVVFCILLPLIAIGTVSWGIFLKGFLVSFPISTLVIFFVPIVAWGNRFATLFGVKEKSTPFVLLSTIVVALIMGTFMSFLMTAVNAGIGPWFFGAWLSVLPISLLAAYVVSLIGIGTGLPIAKKLDEPPQ